MRVRRTVRVAFRILGLTAKQIELFKREVKSAGEVRTNTLFREPRVRTLVFYLRPRQKYSDLLKFLKTHKVRKSSYGIWVSLITSNDTGGVHVPAHILKLYEKTGGNLDFSFTCG